MINPSDGPADKSHQMHAEFLLRLTNVTPAPVEGDPSEIFYRIGFAAATQVCQRQQRRTGLAVIAASMVMLCLVGTVSYRMGEQSSALTVSHVDSPKYVEPTIVPDQTAMAVTESKTRSDRSSLASPSIVSLLASARTTSSPERPLSLVGAKSLRQSLNAKGHSVATENHALADPVNHEPILRRNGWQIVMPNL